MRNAAEGESSAAIAERVALTKLLDALLHSFGVSTAPHNHGPEEPACDCGPEGWGLNNAQADAISNLRRAIRAAASSPDVAAIQREAAREALTKLAKQLRATSISGDEFFASYAKAFRDREYPAPAPEPPSVTVNGWRVTWDGERTDFPWRAVNESGAVRRCGGLGMLICECHINDADVVRVLALREGRGDGQ